MPEIRVLDIFSETGQFLIFCMMIEAWLSIVRKTWKSQGIKSWLGKTCKSQGTLLKESKMLLETMLFHCETRPGANFGNFSRQNNEVTLMCVLLMQNTFLYMYNISSATIDSNWLNTFRHDHLKHFCPYLLMWYVSIERQL